MFALFLYVDSHNYPKTDLTALLYKLICDSFLVADIFFATGDLREPNLSIVKSSTSLLVLFLMSGEFMSKLVGLASFLNRLIKLCSFSLPADFRLYYSSSGLSGVTLSMESDLTDRLLFDIGLELLLSSIFFGLRTGDFNFDLFFLLPLSLDLFSATPTSILIVLDSIAYRLLFLFLLFLLIFLAILYYLLKCSTMWSLIFASDLVQRKL